MAVPDQTVRFGLTLSNRGVLLGVTTVEEMLALAERADTSGWDSVWVGDSIFAKPRLDAVVLLSALAVRTRRVRIGPACFASTPLRNAVVLAYQWASLDYLSGGRTVFVACQGRPGPGAGDFEREFQILQVEPASRMRRMEEAIEILRLTSAGEDVSYHGQYHRFEHLTVLPRPIQQPIPIWVTANPDLRKPRNVESAYRRVARLGDGWMTTRPTPAELRGSLEMIRGYAREIGRPLPSGFEVAVYHNINVNDDPEAAFAESKRFLDAYYEVDFARPVIENWVALGPPGACVDHLRRLVAAGATTITLRLAGYDQARQFRRVTDEVLPALR